MHDLDEEHYHDIGERVAGGDDAVVWTTVGFDVGSSTTQIVFSRVTLARRDAYYVVADRAVLHESAVILTPYRSPEQIDQKQLARFIDNEYAAAKLKRQDVDTGAIILTGLALSTANARAIADAVADESGRFVAVSAGDILEARLAASGTGVPALSARRKGVIVHIDIGGGTTKLSAWRNGKALGVAAIDVGARLITFDGDGRVVRIEPPAAGIVDDLRLDVKVGATLDPAVRERIAGAMARNVLRYAGVLREPPRGRPLLRTAPLFAEADAPRVDAVIFSGGVSEYVYGRESRTFGDLGLHLGRAIRAEVAALGVKLLPFERGIRATVLGVSQHSMQLSGNTIFVSNPDELPLRNLPVFAAELDLGAGEDDLDARSITRRLDELLAPYVSTGAARAPVLAFKWTGVPTRRRLDAVARGIARALEPRLGSADPCVVIVDGDVAGVLGARLEQAFAGRRGVICVDGVHVHEFDHLDLGAYAPYTRALPVIVKSLLFAGQKPHGHVHAGHHT